MAETVEFWVAEDINDPGWFVCSQRFHDGSSAAFTLRDVRRALQFRRRSDVLNYANPREFRPRKITK